MSFKIFRELDNGELVEVATFGDSEKAEAMVRTLKEHWPAVYLIAETKSDQSE